MNATFDFMPPSQIEQLKSFHARYQKEEKERQFNKAFDAIKQFAKVVATIPSYMEEMCSRDIPIEEKEKNIRMVMDLMDSVRRDQVKKFNECIYQANIKTISDKRTIHG